MYFLSCNIIFLGTIVDHIKANLANTGKDPLDSVTSVFS